MLDTKDMTLKDLIESKLITPVIASLYDKRGAETPYEWFSRRDMLKSGISSVDELLDHVLKKHSGTIGSDEKSGLKLFLLALEDRQGSFHALDIKKKVEERGFKISFKSFKEDLCQECFT